MEPFNESLIIPSARATNLFLIPVFFKFAGGIFHIFFGQRGNCTGRFDPANNAKSPVGDGEGKNVIETSSGIGRPGNWQIRGTLGLVEGVYKAQK